MVMPRYLVWDIYLNALNFFLSSRKIFTATVALRSTSAQPWPHRRRTGWKYSLISRSSVSHTNFYINGPSTEACGHPLSAFFLQDLWFRAHDHGPELPKLCVNLYTRLNALENSRKIPKTDLLLALLTWLFNVLTESSIDLPLWKPNRFLLIRASFSQGFNSLMYVDSENTSPVQTFRRSDTDLKACS